MRRHRALWALGLSLFAASSATGYTRNIMLTGYWPPTNNMLRPWSQNPEQNPGGWIGKNWEGRGYDIYSYFPEFPSGMLDEGVGDFMVDYQDTSKDFWATVAELQPIAIITFSRGGVLNRWEVETQQRNLDLWGGDFVAPTQPTPSPPDDSVPVGHVRHSSLPTTQIVDAVNDADIPVFAFQDVNGFGGGFVSEFIAYHGTWYHDLHSDPSDPAWNIAAGHIHVSGSLSLVNATLATQITLRTLTSYLDTQIPEPATLAMLTGLAAFGRRLRR